MMEPAQKALDDVFSSVKLSAPNVDFYMNTDGENRFFDIPPRFTGNSFGGSYGYENLNDASFSSLKAVPFDKSKYLIIKQTGGDKNEQTGSIF